MCCLFCIKGVSLPVLNVSMLYYTSNYTLMCCLFCVTGVTLPVLNVSMLFSTTCWSASKHFLPTVHYIHTGADVIWSAIYLCILFKHSVLLSYIFRHLLGTNLNEYTNILSIIRQDNWSIHISVDKYCIP